MSFGKTNYRHGGTRGGQDQFKWDDVKNDKQRENYLGHSVQAPVGRWQKGKDLSWYTKLSKDDRSASLKEEIALAKQRDQDLMDQALGIAPRKRAEPTGQLDAFELKELLKRGASDREGLEAERIEGLGAAPVAEDFGSQKQKKTLAEKYQETLARGGEHEGEEDLHGLRGSGEGGGGGAVQKTSSMAKDSERAQKKAAKKMMKKQKKAAKKEKKNIRKEKEKKEERGRSRSRSRDRARSPSTPSRSRSRSSSRSPSPAARRHNQRRRSRSRSRSHDDRHRRQVDDHRRRGHTTSRTSRSCSRSRSADRRSTTRGRSPPNDFYHRRRHHQERRSFSRDRSPRPRR